MAPRPRTPEADAGNGILRQPRGKTIRKPKLSSTPISEVFLNACEEMDWKKIRACLDLGVDINCRGADNHSALYHSLRCSSLPGMKKVCDFLITHPDLDVDRLNEEEIIMQFCSRGYENQLSKLCNLPGIDVNAGNPLYYAILYHNLEAINILAEKPGLDWNGGEVIFENCPIVMALDRGYADIVELFLAQPSLNPSGTDYEGNSVGHIAVEYSFTKKYDSRKVNVSAFPVKCVELLSKDPRVNWNARNRNGETPIMLALKNKEREMVKILLRTPGVDLGDVARTSEGQAILKEMICKVSECPVCLRQFARDSRVFQCSVGHFVCGGCHPRVQSCPTCRGQMLGRAHGFENVLREL